MPDISTNRRLAKNTVFLYCRMFIIMGVTFYTTRVLLHVLGVNDYGIYNTIAGVVVLFAFLNTAMVSTTQRFLNFYLGKGDEQQAAASFSMSLTVHICIGLLVCLMGEIIGLWFLYYKMSLPPDRFMAAFWTLHLAVASTFVNIVKSPYNACIIAFEKMDFYAYVSIVEAVLKLAIVYILSFSATDHLILYGILLLVVTLIVAYVYKLYCNHHYSISKFKFVKDRLLFSNLFQFSAFSLLGNAANMGAQQGVNLMVNSFTNVAVNAAIGVSNQLSHGIYSFITNFQVAFNPILVKMYAREDFHDLKQMICQVSRYSFYLMMMISLPFLIYTDEFLHLWLKEVPEYSVPFCRLITLTLLIDTIAEPLWKTVQASGNIKRYQVFTSIIILSNLPIAYMILSVGLSPVYIFVAKFLINAVAYCYRAFYVKSLINFSSALYIRSVMIPIGLTSTAMLFIGGLSVYFIENYLLSSIVVFCASAGIVYLLGLTTNERRFVLQTIKNKLNVNNKKAI